MSDQEKNEKDVSPQDTSHAKSETHPMCENAPDQEKCEAFVERLDDAKNNIDRQKG